MKFYIKHYKTIHHLQLMLTIYLFFLIMGVNLIEWPLTSLFFIAINYPISNFLIKMCGIEEGIESYLQKKRENS